MPRFHYRTGKRSGVSVGAGWVLIAWVLLLGVFAVPIVWLLGVLGLQGSSVAATILCAAVMVAVAWIADRKRR